MAHFSYFSNIHFFYSEIRFKFIFSTVCLLYFRTLCDLGSTQLEIRSRIDLQTRISQGWRQEDPNHLKWPRRKQLRYGRWFLFLSRKFYNFNFTNFFINYSFSSNFFRSSWSYLCWGHHPWSFHCWPQFQVIIYCLKKIWFHEFFDYFAKKYYLFFQVCLQYFVAFQVEHTNRRMAQENKPFRWRWWFW